MTETRPIPRYWHNHPHATEDEAKRCILLYQPGSQASRKEGCYCKQGHRVMSCPLHGATRWHGPHE